MLTMMKRIANLSVYKLLGYVLLGIGAYVILNADNTNLQTNSLVSFDPKSWWEIDKLLENRKKSLKTLLYIYLSNTSTDLQHYRSI